MSYLIVPKNYKQLLTMRQTEQGIKLIKDFFQQNLSTGLQLRRVTAPLFVLKGMGINDDLNGVERPVAFDILETSGKVRHFGVSNHNPYQIQLLQKIEELTLYILQQERTIQELKQEISDIKR